MIFFSDVPPVPSPTPYLRALSTRFDSAWPISSRLPCIIRFGSIPLSLFSGTFFPISQLPAWIRPLAYATPLWHGAALCRSLALGTVTPGSAAIHIGYLAVMAAIGLWAGARSYRRRLYV